MVDYGYQSTAVASYGPRHPVCWDGGTEHLMESVTNNARYFALATTDPVTGPQFATGFGFTDTTSSLAPYNYQSQFVRPGLVPIRTYRDSDHTYRVSVMQAVGSTLSEVGNVGFPSQTFSATGFIRAVQAYPGNPTVYLYGNTFAGSAYTVEGFTATIDAAGAISAPVSIGTVTHPAGVFPGGGTDYLGNLHSALVFSARLGLDQTTRALWDSATPTAIRDAYPLIPNPVLGADKTRDVYVANARAIPGHLYAVRRTAANVYTEVSDLSVSTDGSVWTTAATWAPPAGSSFVVAGVTKRGRVVAYTTNGTTIRAFYDIFGAAEEFTPTPGLLVGAYLYVEPTDFTDDAPDTDAWLTGDGSGSDGSTFLVTRTAIQVNNAHHGDLVAAYTTDASSDPRRVRFSGLGVGFGDSETVYSQDFPGGVDPAGWTWSAGPGSGAYINHDEVTGLTDGPEGISTAYRVRQTAVGPIFGQVQFLSPLPVFTVTGPTVLTFWAKTTDPGNTTHVNDTDTIPAYTAMFVSELDTGNGANVPSNPNLGWQQYRIDLDPGRYRIQIPTSIADGFVGPSETLVTGIRVGQTPSSPFFPVPEDRISVSFECQIGSAASGLYAQPMVEWGTPDDTQPDGTRIVGEEAVGTPYAFGGDSAWTQVDFTEPVPAGPTLWRPSLAFYTQVDQRTPAVPASVLYVGNSEVGNNVTSLALPTGTQVGDLLMVLMHAGAGFGDIRLTCTDPRIVTTAFHTYDFGSSWPENMRVAWGWATDLGPLVVDVHALDGNSHATVYSYRVTGAITEAISFDSGTHNTNVACRPTIPDADLVILGEVGNDAQRPVMATDSPGWTRDAGPNNEVTYHRSLPGPAHLVDGVAEFYEWTALALGVNDRPQAPDPVWAIEDVAEDTTIYLDCVYVPENGRSVADQPYLDGDQPYGVWEGTPRHATSLLVPPETSE